MLTLHVFEAWELRMHPLWSYSSSRRRFWGRLVWLGMVWKMVRRLNPEKWGSADGVHTQAVVAAARTVARATTVWL